MQRSTEEYEVWEGKIYVDGAGGGEDACKDGVGVIRGMFCLWCGDISSFSSFLYGSSIFYFVEMFLLNYFIASVLCLLKLHPPVFWLGRRRDVRRIDQIMYISNQNRSCHITSSSTPAAATPNFVSPSSIYMLPYHLKSLHRPMPLGRSVRNVGKPGPSLNTQDRNRKARMRVPLLQRRRWKKPRETSISASLGGIRGIKAWRFLLLLLFL